jgi:hypothetical protein
VFITTAASSGDKLCQNGFGQKVIRILLAKSKKLDSISSHYEVWQLTAIYFVQYVRRKRNKLEETQAFMLSSYFGSTPPLPSTCICRLTKNKVQRIRAKACSSFNKTGNETLFNFLNKESAQNKPYSKFGAF